MCRKSSREPIFLSLVALACFGCHGRDDADLGEDEGISDESGASQDDSDDGDHGQEEGGRLDLAFPDAPGGDDECAAITVALDPVIPTVVLLVDQSGSMTDDFGSQSRWEAVYETLMDSQDGVVKPLENRIRFGLALYTSEGGNEGGECPMLINVAPAMANHQAIDAAFAPQEPIGDTPTGESLMAVAESLAGLELDGPGIIVLATDGEPDTCEEPNPQNGQAESVAAAQSANDLGIETYVISVGNEVSDEHLQDMANAGVGLEVDGDENAPFYAAYDADDLLGAFDDIIGSVASCSFHLDGVVDLETMCEGTVILDGEELDCGADWTMPDPSTLDLQGAACDVIKDGEAHELEASWPCGSIEVG